MSRFLVTLKLAPAFRISRRNSVDFATDKPFWLVTTTRVAPEKATLNEATNSSFCVRSTQSSPLSGTGHHLGSLVPVASGSVANHEPGSPVPEVQAIIRKRHICGVLPVLLSVQAVKPLPGCNIPAARGPAVSDRSEPACRIIADRTVPIHSPAGLRIPFSLGRPAPEAVRCPA